jgi:hypothetical protein
LGGSGLSAFRVRFVDRERRGVLERCNSRVS